MDGEGVFFMFVIIIVLFVTLSYQDDKNNTKIYTRCLEMIKTDNAKEVCKYINEGDKK